MYQLIETTAYGILIYCSIKYVFKILLFFWECFVTNSPSAIAKRETIEKRNWELAHPGEKWYPAYEYDIENMYLG